MKILMVRHGKTVMIIDEGVTKRNLGRYEGQSNENEIFNEFRYYTKNVPVESEFYMISF